MAAIIRTLLHNPSKAHSPSLEARSRSDTSHPGSMLSISFSFMAPSADDEDCRTSLAAPDRALLAPFEVFSATITASPSIALTTGETCSSYTGQMC